MRIGLMPIIRGTGCLSNCDALRAGRTLYPVGKRSANDSSRFCPIIFDNTKASRYTVRQVKQCGPLAQLAEQLTLNQRVRGSSPWRVTYTTKKSATHLGGTFVLWFVAVSA